MHNAIISNALIINELSYHYYNLNTKIRYSLLIIHYSLIH